MSEKQMKCTQTKIYEKIAKAFKFNWKAKN